MVDDEVEVLLIRKVEDLVELVDIHEVYDDMDHVVILDEMLTEILDEMQIGTEHILKTQVELLLDEVVDVVMVLDEVEEHDENLVITDEISLLEHEK
jgi:hypothetical protein